MCAFLFCYFFLVFLFLFLLLSLLLLLLQTAEKPVPMTSQKLVSILSGEGSRWNWNMFFSGG